MNASKQFVAAVFLACIGSGCNIADDRPTGNPPAGEKPAAIAAAGPAMQHAIRWEPTRAQAPANAPAGPVEQHGIRWEPTLAEAIGRSGKFDPGKPIVLLRLLGTLDDKL